MVTSAIADLDGLGILVGQGAYWNYHYKLGHNLAFGILACTICAVLSKRRAFAFCIYLALFHLHLLMDVFGSGPGWPIYYLWPFSSRIIDNTRLSWEFFSWQNISIGIAFIAWTIVIAVRLGRTPLEAIMPNLDRQLVDWLRRRFHFHRSPQKADNEQAREAVR
jgi:hypothetical protein